jgi:Protein of unknown function (DUF2946)
MDSWVEKAMQRWPNVPALFGWLGLDRRGRWLIKGEPITHPRIVATIDRNYGVDRHGRWYFQNGPQRGYIELSCAPFVLRRDERGFITHNGLRVVTPTRACVDEEGTIGLLTEHGFGQVQGSDLDWVLARLTLRGVLLGESDLEALLALPSGACSDVYLNLDEHALQLERVDAAQAPDIFGFERNPQPFADERVSNGAPD